MALWKPFRGSRSDLVNVPKHDGYVYFCDDGSLHFDYTDSEGNLERKQVTSGEAEKLLGYDISNVLNSSESELPTSKAVQDALNTLFEQIATDLVGQKVAEGGEIFNDYENNQAKTAYSHASGSNTIAGGSGFTITAVSANDGYKPEYTEIVLNLDSTEGLEIGDVCSAKISSNFVDFGKITAISGELVVVDNYPDTLTLDVLNRTTVGPNPIEGAQTPVFWIGRKQNIGTITIDASQHTEGAYTTAIMYAAHAEGYNTIACGRYSHAEGTSTYSGYAAHAEGKSTKALGEYSHAEGSGTEAIAHKSHSEGESTIAKGLASHAEGYTTTTEGKGAHAEGESTKALGDKSHAEGGWTEATGHGAHAEGLYSKATAEGAHAEGGTYSGGGSTASGTSSHAEGKSTASGDRAHSEGLDTTASGENSHAEGRLSNAYGYCSHVEGRETKAYGNSVSGEAGAHAEGYSTTATGKGTHSEGSSTSATGEGAHSEGVRTQALSGGTHAEGIGTVAVRNGSHAEGYTKNKPTATNYDDLKTEWDNRAGDNKFTAALGQGSHAEGVGTLAYGYASHAEGNSAQATAEASHAEGKATASGTYSHAEGRANASADTAHAEGSGTASSSYSHAEGYLTEASAAYTHAEGNSAKATTEGAHAEGKATASGSYSHAEGSSTATARYSHTEGENTKTEGEAGACHAEGYNTVAVSNRTSYYQRGAHAEGDSTRAEGQGAHSEGVDTSATGGGSHSEGTRTAANGQGAHAEGYGPATDKKVTATGVGAHAEGYYTTASGQGAHAEGETTKASGQASHAEGLSTTASGHRAHAEGQGTVASGQDSHAEGNGTKAEASCAHAEGQSTTSSAQAAHAEGHGTTASAHAAHAEGLDTQALNHRTHAEGWGTKTCSKSDDITGHGQHVQGRFNNTTDSKYAHIVGAGTSDTDRKDIHTIDWSGNSWYSGNVFVGGTSMQNATRLATSAELQQIETVASEAKTSADTLKTELARAKRKITRLESEVRNLEQASAGVTYVSYQESVKAESEIPFSVVPENALPSATIDRVYGNSSTSIKKTPVSLNLSNLDRTQDDFTITFDQENQTMTLNGSVGNIEISDYTEYFGTKSASAPISIELVHVSGSCSLGSKGAYFGITVWDGGYSPAGSGMIDYSNTTFNSTPGKTGDYASANGERYYSVGTISIYGGDFTLNNFVVKIKAATEINTLHGSFETLSILTASASESGDEPVVTPLIEDISNFQDLEGFGGGVSSKCGNYIEWTDDDKILYQRMSKVITLTGNETLTSYETYSNVADMHMYGVKVTLSDEAAVSRNEIIVSAFGDHAVSVSRNNATSDHWYDDKSAILVSADGDGLYIVCQETLEGNTESFRNKLKELYDKGTPLIVEYILKEPPAPVDITDRIDFNGYIDVSDSELLGIGDLVAGSLVDFDITYQLKVSE